jgi:hypothetical protein
MSQTVASQQMSKIETYLEWLTIHEYESDE